jgi:hypothetical protein
VTEIEKRDQELLKRDINDRLLELNGLTHALELFFFECDLERMKKDRFEPGLLFAIQKRLYNDLHSQFQRLIN